MAKATKRRGKGGNAKRGRTAARRTRTTRARATRAKTSTAMDRRLAELEADIRSLREEISALRGRTHDVPVIAFGAPAEDQPGT